MYNTYILLLSILKTYRLQLSMKAATAAENICPVFRTSTVPFSMGAESVTNVISSAPFEQLCSQFLLKLHKPAGKGRLREMEKF